MKKTYELTVSNIEQLPAKLKQIPLGSKIHLPDKPSSYPNLELSKHLNNRELAITFSVGNDYNGGNFSLIIIEFNKYLETIQNNKNIKELLIVSGSTARKINTLHILDKLHTQVDETIFPPNFIFSVAYNCQSVNQALENKRLILKLKYKFVKKVYIQITDEIEKITAAINFIRSLRPNILIAVCLFQPWEISLARFKFRPWKGVVLSENFLVSSENAEIVNQLNLKRLELLEVEIVITK